MNRNALKRSRSKQHIARLHISFISETTVRQNPAQQDVIETDLPGRLDRLTWGRFHTLIIFALGITWLLDGLKVTLAGAVRGALSFGWLTDRLGRRKLFFITLFLYVAATAFSWNLASFVLFRFLTGAGIGGEYTAINSTIQEFTPARYRGWTDLAINGTFWVGAAGRWCCSIPACCRRTGAGAGAF